jgi:U4/U6 small nuclear ribonucleoprotein PRP4
MASSRPSGSGGGASNHVQVLNLSAASQRELEKHQAVLRDLEAKKIAATIDVPTLPEQVRQALRELGEPVRLFGENLANVRDRLRMELARRQVAMGDLGAGAVKKERVGGMEEEDEEQGEEEEEVTKYTRASTELVEARQAMALFSMDRASVRLRRERELKGAAVKRKRFSEEKNNEASLELERLDAGCPKLYKSLRQMVLEGSQYGDSRSLSSICSKRVCETPLVVTGSWTGTLHLWDGSSPLLTKVGEKAMCHEDRIMGLAMQTSDDESSALVCTTSIDLTGRLWRVQKLDTLMDENEEENKERFPWSITEQACLRGHASRLSRAAFHPMKRHVATTSFDHSWRLWDVESTKECLLLQDGHWKEVYGVGFHPDGSLCATTDFSGVCQIWDLRTGKAIRHFVSHAKRVLNAEFHPFNGFQLATAGDDGTIKIFDLRKRREHTSIPAHSNLVTRLCFDPSAGEYMASCSFDGTVKAWSTRNWKMLNSLRGHQGKVSGVDILATDKAALVSCGFDKTLKMWQ